MRLLIHILCGVTLLIGGMSFGHAQGLSSPESVVWDAESQRYLVSNTGDGLLRAVSTDGTVTTYGLEARASHGLVIVGKRLYACYRNSVRAYDLETEVLVDVHTISGSRFLNGICADDDGHLYISDFSTQVIFKIGLDAAGDMKHSTIWKRLDRIPNGLAYEAGADKLLALTWGADAEIFHIDCKTARLDKRQVTTYDNLEGIVVDQYGGYYVSAWSTGVIAYFSAAGETTGDEVRLGELDKPTGLWLGADDRLIHLSSSSDRIEGLEEESEKSELSLMELSAFPNPVATNSLISYELDQPGKVLISIYDCRGNLVEVLTEVEKRAGPNQYLYERGKMANGLYFIRIQSAGQSEAMAITLAD